jgi:hypothetical protein
MYIFYLFWSGKLGALESFPDKSLTSDKDIDPDIERHNQVKHNIEPQT